MKIKETLLKRMNFKKACMLGMLFGACWNLLLLLALPVCCHSDFSICKAIFFLYYYSVGLVPEYIFKFLVALDIVSMHDYIVFVIISFATSSLMGGIIFTLLYCFLKITNFLMAFWNNK